MATRFTLTFEGEEDGRVIVCHKRVSDNRRGVVFDLAAMLQHDIGRPDCLLAEAIVCLSEFDLSEDHPFAKETTALCEAARNLISCYDKFDRESALQ